MACLLCCSSLALAAVPARLAFDVPADRGEGTKTIVTVSKSTPELPRKSEGDVIELTDGRLLLVSMEFGGDGSDFATTRLVAHESSDGGLTWGGHRVITDTAPGDVNVYSPNLIRAKDGGILLLFHRQHGKVGSGYSYTLHAWKSADEGKTFSPLAEFAARKDFALCNAHRQTAGFRSSAAARESGRARRSWSGGQVRRHRPVQRRRRPHLDGGRQPAHAAEARGDGAARRAGGRRPRPHGDAQPARHAAPLRVHRRRRALVRTEKHRPDVARVLPGADPHPFDGRPAHDLEQQPSTPISARTTASAAR